MKDITHIFFDLDHTLWDHDLNANTVLQNMYREFGLQNIVTMDSEAFLKRYRKVNDKLWHDYSFGKIDRDYLRVNRFKIVLEKCGAVDFSISDSLSDYFLYHCPRQSGLIDGADMVLNYLVKKYHMSIITNGFEDVQKVKMETSQLNKYFKKVFTSETIGKKKPDPGVFHYAMDELGIKSHQVVMIGDNLKADIHGAMNANITPIYFNPLGTVKSDCQWQISHLSELMKIL